MKKVFNKYNLVLFVSGCVDIFLIDIMLKYFGGKGLSFLEMVLIGLFMFMLVVCRYKDIKIKVLESKLDEYEFDNEIVD